MGLVAGVKIDWLKIAGVVAIVCLIVLGGYGAYNYYFCKPTPIVQYYTVMPGGKIEQKTEQKKTGGHIFTGIYGNKNTVGGVIGWLW